MKMRVNHKVSFDKFSLHEGDLNSNPFMEFDKWFKRAEKQSMPATNAMSLVTVSQEMQPSIRTVLLKYYDDEGLTFFTNYKSKKAREVDTNPKVALKFFWPILEQQVIIQGRAEKISKLKSLQYFLSRPKESQIGAWCSDQSESLNSRAELVARFEAFKSRFNKNEIPKPQNWGGYRVKPHFFEFWQGREHRLHDRFQYKLEENGEWLSSRVAP